MGNVMNETIDSSNVFKFFFYINQLYLSIKYQLDNKFTRCFI